MPNLGLILGVSNLLLQGCALGLVFFRKRQGDFPFFVLFLFSSLVTGFACFLTLRSPRVYFDVFWIGEGVNILCSFLALREAFHHIFRNFYEVPWFRMMFWTFGSLVLGTAIIRAFWWPANDLAGRLPGLIAGEIAISVLQDGILVLFFVLVIFFRMRWRQHAFGIALGFGIAASGKLLALVLRSEIGMKFNPIARFAPAIAYGIAVLVWVAFFAAAHPEQAVTGDLALETLLLEVARYRNSLRGIRQR